MAVKTFISNNATLLGTGWNTVYNFSESTLWQPVNSSLFCPPQVPWGTIEPFIANFSVSQAKW
jgi:hypothetical protein